jgi:hypothetical protein
LESDGTDLSSMRSIDSRCELGNANPKCKWGRPEGRPHSHQRVDFPKKVLGAQCRCRWFPIRRSVSASSVTGARTGIRFRRRFGSKLLETEASCCWSRSTRRFRDRSSVMAIHWVLASSPAEAFAMPPRRTTGKSGRCRRCFAFLSNDRLALSRNSHQSDLEDRADSCRHPDRV